LTPVLTRRAARIGPELLARAQGGLAALQLAMAGDNFELLQMRLDALDALAEKELAGFRRNAALDFAFGFVKALAVALLVRAVIPEPFRIPSGSMIPTLDIGDQIFVNKFI